MREFLSALRSGFGFLSTIPVGITMEGIENLMKHAYLIPIIGAVLGIILGIIGYIFSIIFPQAIIPFAIIIGIYFLTGFNHIDGLADFGDGIAAHGTREKKIAAMRDTAVGTGGLVFCMIALLGVFESLSSVSKVMLPAALIVAETGAKQSMVTVAAFGNKLHEGFGSITVENTKLSDFIIGMIFTGAVSYFFLGILGIEALIVSQLAAFLVLNTANRHFGGVSGDIIGASNEVGRLAALLFIGGFAWMQL